MTNEELNTALYKKMFAEQEQFKGWLLTQPPERILEHSYEYTVREDFLLSLEYNNLTNSQVAALLASPTPLDDLFTSTRRWNPVTWRRSGPALKTGQNR